MANDDLMRLAAKWRTENGDYPEAKRDCAGDLERAIAQRAPLPDNASLVPGVMHCAKCKFRLHRTTLYVRSGTAGPGDSKTEPCPNGCGPLWPVTWEQEAREAIELATDMHEKLQASLHGAVPEGWAPTDEQYREWCETHDMQESVSREAFDDAASLYLLAAPIPQQPEAEPAAVIQSLTTEAAGGDAVADALLWLRSALDCFPWSPGQREAAESAYAAAISPTPAADAGGVTEEMVERAAVGIHEYRRAYSCRGLLSEQDDGYQARVRGQARAALTAALTPEVRHA